LSGYVFATKARIGNRKNIVKQQYVLQIKGKERKSIYIAPFCTKVHTKRSGMDHTVLPANNTMPAYCPHNMVNFGPLAAELGLPVWGTPVNFDGFRDLAALLHGSQVVSVSQTLRH